MKGMPIAGDPTQRIRPICAGNSTGAENKNGATGRVYGAGKGILG
jgi:hypothetical protein